MKKSLLKVLFLATFAVSALQITSCKDKKTTTDSTTTTTTADTASMVTPTPAPVEVSTDDALTTSAKDATKDYPGVNVSVNNGELTLTGNITRDKLPDLMKALNGLQPKKINNNLTIK